MNEKELRQLSKAAYDATRRLGSPGLIDAVDILEVIDGMGYQVTPKQPEQQPEEWNGEGLPPVYTRCEVREGGLNSKVFRDWSECVVLARNIGSAGEMQHVIIDFNGDAAMLYGSDFVEFRPIRTEKEKLVEKAKESVGDIWVLSHEELIDALYDAGMLKQPDSNNTLPDLLNGKQVAEIKSLFSSCTNHADSYLGAQVLEIIKHEGNND